MLKRVWLYGVALGGVALGLPLAPAEAASIPDCAGPVEIADAHIARVEPTNDALVLRDGRALHLEGIRFPHAGPDRAPSFVAQQAFEAVSAMAKGKHLAVYAVPPKEDRYDRVRGQIFGDDWLQVTLLRMGAVRVDIAPDRTECAAQLYAAESEARAAGRGLWAQPTYGLRTPDSVGGDTGSFQIVQGQVLSADVKDGRAYLDFGTDWKTDFTVTVSPDDMANFRIQGVDPRDYAGKVVRVRGIVQQFNGPEIEIANPEQVEVLP
ncbi:MAG TPA: thermonuclease family protein [Rhizomicrobium sp.]|nr:thermonuclease family protein [Rhizomicrobium sp.]